MSSHIAEMLGRYKSIILIAITITTFLYVIPFDGIMVARPAAAQGSGEGGPFGPKGPCEADDENPPPGCTDIGLPQNPEDTL